MGALDYNVPLLVQVRDQIRNKPSAHDQTLYASSKLVDAVKKAFGRGRRSQYVVECPTTACVAGWAVHFSGAQLSYDEIDIDIAKERGAKRIETHYCVTAKGEVRFISAHAETSLGLDGFESTKLFEGSNSRGEVLRMLDRFIKDGCKAQGLEVPKKEKKKVATPPPKKALKVEHIKPGQAKQEKVKQHA